MRVAGIDPGRKGAIALVVGGNDIRRSLVVVDLPFTDDGALNYRVYRDIVVRLTPDVAYCENTWPRSSRAPANDGKGMGFISSNKFSRSVGALEGITACYVMDCHKVTPQSWKQRFGLLKTKKKDSCAMAAMLWPEHAKLFERISIDDGRAEAALIATYGAERQGLLRME